MDRVTFFVFVVSVSCSTSFLLQNNFNYVLKQVLMLSRHNVRPPLAKNLSKYSPYEWPDFDTPYGHLTKHGELLEYNLGYFFYEAFMLYGILPEDLKCPDDNVFYVYSDVSKRTLESSKAFVDGFSKYEHCHKEVHHKNGTVDPIFHPIIHNTTKEFKNQVLHEMNLKLQSYSDIGKILNILQDLIDYKDSDECKINKKCDLTKDKNTAEVNAGEKPKLSGPLKIANEIVDAFLMQHHNGKYFNYAWNKINETQLEELVKLKNAYHDITLNSTIVSRDIAKPLLRAMRIILENKSETPKITLLMGHDTNIQTVLKSLDIDVSGVENADKFDVGNIVVFEKWLDAGTNKDLLRINYVYEDWDQMRNVRHDVGIYRYPPRYVTVGSSKCVVDEMGFCLWSDFVSLLSDVTA